METIKVNTRVAIRAVKFDSKNSGNSWSRSKFGDNFAQAMCWGNVVAVHYQKVSVRWDIDNKTTKVQIADLDVIEKSK